MDAFATSGASMPVTVIAGCAQMRERIVPVPIGRDAVEQPGLGAQLRLVVVRASRGSRAVRPSTATEPSASHSEASSRTVASIASGAAPPNMPECDACASVSMRRLNATAPRSATVIAGVSRSQLPESATMIASAARRSRFWSRKFANDGDAVLLLALDEQRDAEVEVAPSTSVSARIAAMCAITPALSSAAPRP